MPMTEEEVMAPMGFQLLVETLEPFARFYEPGVPDDLIISFGAPPERPQITAGDCRRAAETLALLERVEAGRG